MIATPAACKTPGQTSKPKRIMPKGKPWQKGQSGNPHGRPRKEQCFADIARQMLSAKAIKFTLTMPNGEKRQIGITASNTMRHGVIAAMIRESMKGNVNAAKELIDRTDGKVTDSLNIHGDTELNVTFTEVRCTPAE